jgi:cobalt-zinc-cadmium efflux system protein
MHSHHHAGHGSNPHSHLGEHGLSERITGLLGMAVAVTFALVAAELFAGFWGHSIALLSDAIHNLTDVPTLVISWFAMRLARRPPTAQKTFGYHRAGILAAFVNAILLGLVALFLIYESAERFRHPVEVHTSLMLWISLLALVVNGGITFAIHNGRRDLNVRTVWIHNLAAATSSSFIPRGRPSSRT